VAGTRKPGCLGQQIAQDRKEVGHGAPPPRLAELYLPGGDACLRDRSCLLEQVAEAALTGPTVPPQVEHDRDGPIRIVVAKLAADHICRDGQQAASAARLSTRPRSSGQPPFGHVVSLNTALNDIALPDLDNWRRHSKPEP